VLDELHTGAHGICSGRVLTNIERDNGAKAFELASRSFVSGMARQAGIASNSNLWMLRQALGQCHRITLRPLQPQCQCPRPTHR